MLRHLLLNLVQGACFTFASVSSTCSPVSTLQVAHDLGNVLSPRASIVLPDNQKWHNMTTRVAAPRISPGYRLAVEVATESDVAEIVSYANRHDIDFLAVAGGHGEANTLNRLRDGIQINLRKLNFTHIHGDDTATIGGGALQWEVTSQLFAHGRRAVTGLCECVSVIGPLLGGGHSLLQSQHGYAADSLVSANVVLANGTTVQASLAENSSLFWALRGAGHNFGIITSYTVKIYPIPSTYSMYTLTYTEDKIDALFNLVNKIDSNTKQRDPKFFLIGLITRLTARADPMIRYMVIYEGSKAQLDIPAAPFLQLKPADTQLTTNITYEKIFQEMGFGKTSGVCRKQSNFALAGVALNAWNIEGVHKTYDLMKRLTADPRFNASIVPLENYGMAGVQAIDPDSTALAREERDRPILTSAVVMYYGEDPTTKRDAAKYMKKITDALYTGVEDEHRHAYVNYATGSESVEEVYGHEKWRVQKLKGLKKEWDPQNRFRFYNPLMG